MRLINRNIYPLHIWKVSDYIKQAQTNLYKQDVSQFIAMQNIFKKLYFRHLHDYEKLQKQTNKLNNFVKMSVTPARSIADNFQRGSKYYQQEYMRATFETIAQAYQVSKRDNGGSLDNLGYSLFLSAQFSNLSEQFKYALRNNKISFSNLTAVLESLIKLQYVDYEIFSLVILYIKRELQGGDPFSILSGWSGDREYQIQKDNYYNPLETETLQSLRKSSQVQTAIGLIKHFYQESVKQDIEVSITKKHNIQELNSLINEIAETNKNFRKIVEGIISARKQYAKMVEFSSRQQVLRNPNLNLGLLQVQEKLLALKILDINDIRYVEQMKNPKYEVKRIQDILLMYLDVKRLDPILDFVDKSSIQAPNYEESTEASPKKISVMLNLMSRLATLDRFVYHSADGRSLVNLKWQKTLIEQIAPKTVPGDNYKQELNVSRIFRKVYTEFLKTITTFDAKIKSVYKRANGEEKILILDSWCRMGLQQSAIAQFESEKFSLDFNEVSHQNFASVVSLFNDIGLFINNQPLKQELYRKLQEKIAHQEQNLLNFGLQYSINAINYLLQNHRNNSSFSETYSRYLHKLEDKATYYTPTEGENEILVQAFKILAVQIPQKYGCHPVYLNYINSFVNDNYKKNPYLAILRQTSHKLCNKEHQLHKMQIYLNVGIKNGVQNALLLSNSDQTSVDGEFRIGNLNSFIIRLQLKNNIKIHQFSVNSFLSFNSSSDKLFQIKPFAELEQRFADIFFDQNSKLAKHFADLQASILKLLPAFKECLITNQIKFKLSILNKLLNNNAYLQAVEQELTNSVAFILQTLELNKLILLLKEQDIQQRIQRIIPKNPAINNPLQGENKGQNSQDWLTFDVQAIKILLRTVKSNIPEVIITIAKLLKYPEFKRSQASLKGKRQTLQVLDNISNKKTSFEEQFINYRYCSDNKFCEYNDWREKIQQQYILAETSFENLSDLSKILANRLCKGVKNKLNLLPICKHSEVMKRVKLQFKLINDEKSEGKAQKKLTSKEEKELNYIINLQNFKHELKNIFKPKQLLDYIFSFKFIFQLNKKGEDRQSYLLKRDPVQYFNYLEELQERTYMDSPYMRYILSKFIKTDKIKRLIDHRKNVRIHQRTLFQKGVINSAAYYQKITEADNLIIQAVQQLKTKMLDHMQDNLLDGQLKMIQLKKDEIQALESIIKKNITYNRQFDQDFIYANGDYAKALNLKRGRAQSNYIKLYLLKKVAQSKTLNTKQLQYLKSWQDEIAQSVNQFKVYEDFSGLLISQLPWQDLQSLKLKQTSLNSSKDMLVIDLIMQFGLFLDDSLIGAYQKQVKAQLLSQLYSIPWYLFQQSTAIGFKKLQNQVQQTIINENCELNESQIIKLQEMFKIFKTQGFKERNRYAILCARFRQNVQRMNQNYLRSNFIQQYIRHLDEQFMSQYNPKLVREIKDKETQKLWKQVFSITYDDCTTQILKKNSKNILIRLGLLAQRNPPFFGNLLFKLLLHPKLDSFTRESLIAAIEFYKCDLNLDSRDIEELSKMEGRNVRKSSAVLKDLKRVNNTEIGKLLLNKVKLLN